MTLQRVDEQYRGLTYPWGRVEHPGDNPFEVAPGVWWVRFTMPGPLNHINLWLLEDGCGWTIVDTCLNLDSAKAHWEELFGGFMEGKPVPIYSAFFAPHLRGYIYIEARDAHELWS